MFEKYLLQSLPEKEEDWSVLPVSFRVSLKHRPSIGSTVNRSNISTDWELSEKKSLGEVKWNATSGAKDIWRTYFGPRSLSNTSAVSVGAEGLSCKR